MHPRIHNRKTQCIQQLSTAARGIKHTQTHTIIATDLH